MSIMPGIDARAPERTDTRRGLAVSPSRRSTAASRRAIPPSTCSQSPAGCLRPPAAVGGPGFRRDRESGRHRNPQAGHLRQLAPLAAEQVAESVEPSALPLAKEYTYLGRRVAGLGDLLSCVTWRASFHKPPSGPPRSGRTFRRTRGRETKAGPEEACVIQGCYAERRPGVNEYSSATGTYESLAGSLSPQFRLGRRGGRVYACSASR